MKNYQAPTVEVISLAIENEFLTAEGELNTGSQVTGGN